MISFRHIGQAAWRPLAALALVIALVLPIFSPEPASAQSTLPLSAEVAPESTAIFSVIDLDFAGAQWQQAEALLARAGIPDALDLWRDEILQDGAREGDFSAADLDALLGGEMAVIFSPAAIGQLFAMHMQKSGRHMMADAAAATPVSGMTGAAPGIAVVLRPGDPDAAWAYAQRQLDAYASKQSIELQTGSHGSAELIWATPQSSEGASSSSGAMYDDWFTHHGRGDFAVAHTGDYIIAGMTQADVTPIVDVIDGATGSLADAVPAQEIAASLPAESLTFTYVDSQAILSGLGPEAMASIEAMLPPDMPKESLGGPAGFTVSADAAGFRFDTIGMPAEGGDLDATIASNDPAIAEAARQAPQGTFVFSAARLPENAFAGLPFTLAQAVNAVTVGEAMAGDQTSALPSPEEIESELAKAAATLEFDPRTDLFDLLGADFLAFASFPSFGANGIGLNAVAAISTTDAATLATTAHKLAAWIERSAPDANVSVRKVGADTVFAISDPNTKQAPAIEMGVVGDRAVVGIGDGIAQLGASPAASLADDGQFQAVMAMLPGEYSEVAYVDLTQVMGLVAMLASGMVSEPARDAALACADYTDLAAAQAAFDADPAANASLDQDADGQACEDAFAPSGGTPVTASGSLTNIQAFATVAFREDNKAGSSAILYIAEPQS